MTSNIKRAINREIARTYRCIKYVRNIEFKNLGLTNGQHSFLTRIIEQPGISQEELSFMLRIDKTTTAKAIKKLEKKGYVYREKSSVDKRALCLYPTENLIEVFPIINQGIEETANVGCIGFTEHELTAFLNYLERYRENIDIIWLKTKQNNF